MNESPRFEICQVQNCDSSVRDEWNRFVVQSRGSYCHLYEWRAVFEKAYGLSTRYLAIKDRGESVGILPLAIMPKLPMGVVKAVSLPYCNYGGLLVAHGLDAEQLKAAAIKYLTGCGIGKIELRDIAPGMVNAAEVTMTLTLPENSVLLWKKIGDTARNQVRKAQKAGLTLRWGRDQGDDLYAIYAKNMGRLGTPVHSPKFIKEILSSLGEQADVLTVRHEERAIGAMLVIKHGGTWADPMASCLTEFNKFNPNMLMYWESLRAACDTGAKSFDFGRSHKDSGTYRFKKQWGASEVALNYHSYVDGMLLPSVSTNFYRGQSASKLARIWQKLPSLVQMRLGPVVRRWLP